MNVEARAGFVKCLVRGEVLPETLLWARRPTEIHVIRTLPERNRYLPGLRAWTGFRQVGLPIARRPRSHSTSRVGLWGLWKLSMNAVFSFSYGPSSVFRLIDAASIGLSALLMAFVLYHKLFTGLALPAWASQMVTISFFGGINIFGIGILGEYVARIYDELKGRPLYVIAARSPGSGATSRAVGSGDRWSGPKEGGESV